MDITHFGYDLAESVEDFFQKVLDWKNETKPSEDTVKTAKKLVEMMQEKPKSLCVFEDTIIRACSRCQGEMVYRPIYKVLKVEQQKFPEKIS